VSVSGDKGLQLEFTDNKKLLIWNKQSRRTDWSIKKDWTTKTMTKELSNKLFCSGKR